MGLSILMMVGLFLLLLLGGAVIIMAGVWLTDRRSDRPSSGDEA